MSWTLISVFIRKFNVHVVSISFIAGMLSKTLSQKMWTDKINEVEVHYSN